MYRRGLEEINRRMRAAREALDRREWIERRLATDGEELAALEEKVEALAEIAADEQKDVARLEGGGLTAIIGALLGSAEERLETERREALEAMARHELARVEAGALREEMDDLRAEARALADAEREIAELAKQKETWVRQHGGQDAEALAQLDDEASRLRRETRETQRAIAAARATGEALLATSRDLAAAFRASTLGGVKLSEIDEGLRSAQIERVRTALVAAQGALGYFDRELRRSDAAAGLELELGLAARLAELLVSGAFTASTKQSRIDQALNELHDASRKVGQAVPTLEARIETLARRAADIEVERADLLRLWE